MLSVHLHLRLPLLIHRDALNHRAGSEGSKQAGLVLASRRALGASCATNPESLSHYSTESRGDTKDRFCQYRRCHLRLQLGLGPRVVRRRSG